MFLFFYCSQWKIIDNVLPDDLIASTRTAVHKGHLYVAFHSRTQDCVLLRTSDRDLRNWHSLQKPPNTSGCQGLVSHRDGNFYCLSSRSTRYGNGVHLVLFRLNEVMHTPATESDCGSATPLWTELPNGWSPKQQLFPALLGVGSSLLLIGGQCGDSSLDTVQEYSLRNGEWLEVPNWPALPIQRQQQHVASTGETLHVVGGGCVSNNAFNARADIYSMTMSDGRRQWKTDVVKPTPHASPGACSMFGTVALVGGLTRGSNQRHSEAYVWDAPQKEWLRFPDLAVARSEPSLVYFKGSLFAFGGRDAPANFTPAVEQLSITPFVGILHDDS